MSNATAPLGSVLNISHKDCFDGLVSAWVVHRWAIECGYSYEVLYWDYRDYLPDVELFHDRIVIITDFSWPVDYMLKIASVAKQLCVFDHHESAEKNFIGIDFSEDCCPTNVVFDHSRSGAGIAWHQLWANHEMPPIVQAAQDHDLWKFEHETTEPIMAYLGMLGLSFSSVDAIHENWDSAVKGGQLLVKKDNQMVDWHLKMVEYLDLDFFYPGLLIPVVNAPRYIANKVADRLTDRYCLVVMYEDYAGYRKGSFRTNGNWGLNAAEFAAMFNGAGNPKAAGCSFSKDKSTIAQLLGNPAFISKLLTVNPSVPKEGQ